MSPTKFLQSAIGQRAAHLVSSVPKDHDAATMALIDAIDRLPETILGSTHTDPFAGIPTPALGASRALHLVLTAPDKNTHHPRDPHPWASVFLDQCRQLARAELTLAHLETGFMRCHAATENTLEVHIARRLPPGRWRERADAAWWAQHTPATVDNFAARVDLPHGTLDGVDLALSRKVIGYLMDGGYNAAPRPLPIAWLTTGIATALDVCEEAIDSVLAALTLTPTNAAWHAAVPGIAAPPIIALGAEQVIVSHRGVHTDPFRFLTRELRRRAPDAYHTAAIAREDAFRTDLFALFGHRRFITSPGRIELRRKQGSIGTDIDAAVFDRKTGTLAVFELKSHEPFARSSSELERTQANVRAAGRQVAGMLDWLNRHGADEILNRMDRRTAKGFRVHRVQPFVLGRHLIDGGEGPPLDPRAVWATWPTILRLLNHQPVETLGANPITTLAASVARSESLVSPRSVQQETTIDLGPVTLRVHPVRNTIIR